MSSLATAHSVVEPTPLAKRIAGALVILYALVSMAPLAWIVLTGFKTPTDSISYPPKLIFQPTLEGYCNLFTTRTRQTPEYVQTLPPATDRCEEITRSRNMVIASLLPSRQTGVDCLAPVTVGGEPVGVVPVGVVPPGVVPVVVPPIWTVALSSRR